MQGKNLFLSHPHPIAEMNCPAASCGVAGMALGLLIRSKLREIRPPEEIKIFVFPSVRGYPWQIYAC
jgi:hypothetical protein